ncbi:MAG: hypothetical protein K0Q49_1695 [Haloplasmataceae bacterium]|jgi:multiple sugar transport system substrate-binding protein|nr:hypothetical protein [Haloplasmataceae bacterium]
MKKIFSVFLLLILTVVLFACGDSTTSITTVGTTIGTTVGSTTATTTQPRNNIQLTYASWGNATVEEKMIEAFEAKYPYIDVIIDRTITGTGRQFTESLVAAAQAGTVPDVFVIDNVPIAIKNKLALDIAPYWNADADTDKVFDNIASTGVYGDVRYAAPSYQFVRGVLLNKTILEDAGLSAPYIDWTYDEMIELARDFSNPSEYKFGFNGGLNFDATIPSLDDASLGYHTWDGEKFNYANPLWIKGFNLNRQLVQEGVVEAMTGEEKEAVFGSADAWPFVEGHALMSINGSWDVPYVVEQFKTAGYDLAFYPYPAGSAGQRIPVVLDYMVVSKQTSYPEDAYELLKWMSFGEEGWKARIEILEELGEPVTAFPVGDYPEVWEDLRVLAEDIEGMPDNIDLLLLGLGVPDTDKWLPGYNEFFDTWLASTENPYAGLWDGMTPEAIAPIYQEHMTRLINEAYTNLGLSK